MMAGSRRPKKQTQPQDGSQQKQEDRLQAFLEWMSGVGITWSEAIKFEPALAACSGASWGITAAADVREGDLLAQIPKSAVLSVRNTTLADVLALEGIRGGLGLTIAVLHEYTMGEKSRW
jgi:SET domain-containing protein 6